MALENKLGITDSIELAHREEQLTKKRAQELYDKHIHAAHFSCEVIYILGPALKPDT